MFFNLIHPDCLKFSSFLNFVLVLYYFYVSELLNSTSFQFLTRSVLSSTTTLLKHRSLDLPFLLTLSRLSLGLFMEVRWGAARWPCPHNLILLTTILAMDPVGFLPTKRSNLFPYNFNAFNKFTRLTISGGTNFGRGTK